MDVHSTLRSEDRAPALLEALRLPVMGRRGRGRYVTSPTAVPGVSYWATSLPRFRRDAFGVQFEGIGRDRLRFLKSDLIRAGFIDRGEVDDRVTFERPLPFCADSGIDIESLRSAYRDAEAILSRPVEPGERKLTFLEFMQNSPWAGIEIELPERRIEPERPIDF